MGLYQRILSRQSGSGPAFDDPDIISTEIFFIAFLTGFFPRTVVTFIQSRIFLNRNAPSTVITTVKPPITAAQTSGLICETPVRP